MPEDVERSQIIPPTHREATQEQDPGFRRSRLRQRRMGLFISAAFVMLAALVVITSLLMHLDSTRPLATGRQPTAPPAPAGSFVELPSHASHANAPSHAPDR